MAWKKRLKASLSHCITSAKLAGGLAAKYRPNMPPTESAQKVTPASAAARVSPFTSRSVLAARRAWKPGSEIAASVARPAATATGLPDSVPAWYTGPFGASLSMTSARPPKAPTGMPPPMTLPSVVRSGLMPSSFCAQPRSTRKPVITSSKISSAPCASHSRRIVAMNSAVGLTRFMLPAKGSTMMQAISLPISAKVRSSPATSL